MNDENLTPYTKETRARYAEVAKAKKARRKADPVSILRDELPALFDDLLKAARGKPPYEDIGPDRRLLALNKALEYGYGRAISLDKNPVKEPNGEGGDPEKAEGLSIE